MSWDAASYERVSAPLARLGLAALDRLDLRGDEHVLDVGCGTGRVTAALAERLPRGRVLALDVSPEMAARARERLPASVEVLVGDVLELSLPAPVDAILSTATFHWIPDHDALFARLASLLRPGGRLSAQCGGTGNLGGVLAAAAAVARDPRFASALDGFDRGAHYADALETERRLRAAGFSEARCWLRAAPVVPEDPLAYLATIPLRPHLSRLPEDRRDAFTAAVADRLPDPVTVDYVRLEIDATR